MTKRIRLVWFVSGLALGALALVMLFHIARREQIDDDDRAAAAALREYCDFVRLAMNNDALRLADPEQREAALDTFGQLRTFHSRTEIRMCARLAHRELELEPLNAYDRCWVRHDIECLVRLANTAAAATTRREGP